MSKLDRLRQQLFTIAAMVHPRVGRPWLGDVVLVCGCEAVASPWYGITCRSCLRRFERLVAYEDVVLAAIRIGGWPAAKLVAEGLFWRV